MKRCALLGPSPCPLFSPGLLPPAARGLARMRRAHGSAPQHCGHNGKRRAELCGRVERELGVASRLPLRRGLRRCGGCAQQPRATRSPRGRSWTRAPGRRGPGLSILTGATGGIGRRNAKASHSSPGSELQPPTENP